MRKQKYSGLTGSLHEKPSKKIHDKLREWAHIHARTPEYTHSYAQTTRSEVPITSLK